MNRRDIRGNREKRHSRRSLRSLRLKISVLIRGYLDKILNRGVKNAENKKQSF
jgi:hypothetical protein